MEPIWRRYRPHYAWLILASAMLIMLVAIGIRLSFGVLIDPLVAKYGWSRGGISIAYTYQFLIGVPTVLIAGRVAEKIGIRRVSLFSAVIFLAGMLLTATVSQPWQFQIFYGVLTGGFSLAAFTVLIPVLLSRWFHKKLGLALGFMWVSVSIGPALLSPLMRISIEALGWSQTFVMFGIIGGALIVVAASVIRENPAERKLEPYGWSSEVPEVENTVSPVAAITLRQVMRTRAFWLLSAIHALGCVGHSIMLAHVVSIATFAGISSIGAASILSLPMITSIFSRFGMSLISEVKGARFTLVLALLFQAFPTLLLLGAGTMPPFYAFAVLFGLGYGGEMVGFPIFNRQYYRGNAPLSTIYSFQVAGSALGMAFGGWLGGALFDITGQYTWTILASVSAGLLGVIASLILPAHKR